MLTVCYVFGEHEFHMISHSKLYSYLGSIIHVNGEGSQKNKGK